LPCRAGWLGARDCGGRLASRVGALAGCRHREAAVGVGEDGSLGVRVVADGAGDGGPAVAERGVCGTWCCGTAAVVVGVEYVGFGGTAGSRIKGSVRNGLNGAVGPVLVLAHGSRDLYGMVLTARSGGVPSTHGSRDQYGKV
jgi:hypothetical protein